MLRILLFLATNFAVLMLISIVFKVFGIEGLLQNNGVDLNYSALLLMSAVIGFGGAFISLALSKWTAKHAMGVRIIEQPRNHKEAWLLNTVHAQAAAVGISAPEVGIFDASEANAFATGMNRNNALVAVSTGLLKQMNEREVEAVLGHEVSHISNGDMVTLGLIQGVVNTFVIFFARIVGYFVDRVILKNERELGIGYYVTSIIAQIFLSLLATMIVMWFSRHREYRADAGGAQLAGRDNMIAALKRLQAGASSHDLPGEMATLGIDGRKALGLTRLFLSHPPLEERIASLQQRQI